MFAAMTAPVAAAAVLEVVVGVVAVAAAGAAVEIAAAGRANRCSGLSEEKVNVGLGGTQDDPTLCRTAGRLSGQSRIECLSHPKTRHENGLHPDPTAAADWDPWSSPSSFRYQKGRSSISRPNYRRRKVNKSKKKVAGRYRSRAMVARYKVVAALMLTKLELARFG